jgi:outer membrane protein assembly factor BamB
LERRYIELVDKFSQGIYAGSSDEKLQAIIDGGEIGPVEQMVMLAVDESLYLTPQNKYLQDYELPMDWHLADQLIKANSWETLTPLWTEAVKNPESVNLLRQPEYQRCYQTLHSQSPEYLDVVAMLAVLSELKQLAGWQSPAVSETAMEGSMPGSVKADGAAPPAPSTQHKKISKGAIIAILVGVFIGLSLLSISVRDAPTNIEITVISQGRYQSTTPTSGLSFVQTTQRIPARIGEGFGFLGSLRSKPPNSGCQLVFKVGHPPIIQPDGTTITSTIVSEQTIPAEGDPYGMDVYSHPLNHPTGSDNSGEFFYPVNFVFFFRNENELVPGVWTFTIIYDGQQVFAKTFDVYDITEAATLAARKEAVALAAAQTAAAVALAAKQSGKLWEFETGGYVYSSPAIGSDGTVYVGSEDNKLYAINGKSGVKLWEFKTGGGMESSPAIGSDGTVYVGSDDNKLYAINGKSGVKLWEFETGVGVESSPAIGSDGTVYVGSQDNMLYAINGKSGIKLWAFPTGGSVTSSPAIGSDGTVYVGSWDHGLYAFYSRIINDEFYRGLLWGFKTGDEVLSSPAIGSDGTVYVGSDDNKLYAINGKSRGKLWEFETGGGVDSSPAIGSDGTVYVGSGDNKLYAINGKSGVKLWEFETGGYVSSSPAIGSDGTVYVGGGGRGGKLYAIKTDSKDLAKSPWPMRGQNARHTGRTK